MTRNQKIALGCGGAGCLGLVVVAIAGCLIYFFYYNARTRYERAARDYNFNVNLNTNSNFNSNSNDDANDNSNTNSNSSSSSASSMSDDDKHKLYQAGAMSGDSELAKRVNVHLGIMDADGVPTESYQQFMGEHAAWAIRNLGFIRDIGTPDKARAYVDEHLE